MGEAEGAILAIFLMVFGGLAFFIVFVALYAGIANVLLLIYESYKNKRSKKC